MVKLSARFVGLPLLALTLLATARPILAEEGTPASPGSIRIADYLLDRLDSAEMETPDMKRLPEPPTGRWCQPFWYGNGSERLKPYHRRILLHDGSRAWRDMREALVLPKGFKMKLPVNVPPGAELVFTPLALHQSGRSRKVQAKIGCTTAEDYKELWNQEMDSTSPGSLSVWPEAVRVPIPQACTHLTFEVVLDVKKESKVWFVWEGPAIEHRPEISRTPPYNVLFIVVDALRSDVVGVHRRGCDSVSPNMDALEASGTSFVNGFSNGNTTLLSMNAMLLGTHPRALGFLTLWWSGKDRRRQFYERQPPFLTRVLHINGYRSFGAVHNHLFFPGYKYAVDPGFDVLQDCGRDTTDHPLLTKAAIDFMEANRDRRFLVQVNLIAPHQPYSPPKESLEVAKKASKGRKTIPSDNYLGEVHWADVHVGLLMEALERLGLKHNTLVILTADHGEVMDSKHDCYSERDQHHCLQLHGLTLYDEEINVPMMFSLPGIVLPGFTPPDLVQHVDIVPTVLDLLGIPQPDEMTGRSIVPILTTGISMEEVPVYSERWLARSIRTSQYHLILHTRKDDICPTVAKKVCKSGEWVELYDVIEDPLERNEISKDHPDVVEKLKQLVIDTREFLYQKSGGEGPNP